MGYPQWHAKGLPVDSSPAGLSVASLAPRQSRPLHGWAMIWTLLGIFAGGIALNLTPCIYPLIPVTVSYFAGKSSQRRGKERRQLRLVDFLPAEQFLVRMAEIRKIQ